jgi:hypothetical protein
MSHHTTRRSFLSALGLTAAGLSILPHRLHAATEVPMQSKWDLSWLEVLNGKHRQVFDLGSRHPQKLGNPLRVPKNWLNAHHEVYGLSDNELNTCAGISYDAFPLNASDELWRAYPIGEHWQIKDPETDKWSMRNLWIDPTPGITADSTLKTLVSRGTIFWQCNNALNGAVSELAQITGKDVAKVRAEVVAGLNPWVKLVPAHTMLLGLVQERKFSYEKL